MIILDTSVLVAILFKDDRRHAQAVNLIGKVEEPLAIPNSVLVETFGVLRRLTRDEAFVSSSIKRLAEKYTLIAESIEVIDASVNEYSEKFSKLSLIDCQLVEIHRQTGIQVLTFDEELKKELESTV